MKPQSSIFATGTLWIQRMRDGDGEYYIAWRPDTSQLFSDSKSLLAWAKWPPKTPTGDALRLWLLDASVKEPPPSPASAPSAKAAEGALAPEDPNYATRTVI